MPVPDPRQQPRVRLAPDGVERESAVAGAVVADRGDALWATGAGAQRRRRRDDLRAGAASRQRGRLVGRERLGGERRRAAGPERASGGARRGDDRRNERTRRRRAARARRSRAAPALHAGARVATVGPRHARHRGRPRRHRLHRIGRASCAGFGVGTDRCESGRYHGAIGRDAPAGPARRSGFRAGFSSSGCRCSCLLTGRSRARSVTRSSSS